MADRDVFSDDISSLWGPALEGELAPPRMNGTVAAKAAPPTNGVAMNGTAITNGHEPSSASTHGSHVEATSDDASEDVARLVDALARRTTDAVRRSELHTLRAEVEDAFTQQLAVALYELLSASRDRFAAVEKHITARLDGVATRVYQSIETQGERVAAAIDTRQRDVASMRTELEEIGKRFAGQGEAFASFQREIRHEVGRIGDAAAAQKAEVVRQSEIDAERAAGSGAALAERLQRSEGRQVAVAQEIENVGDRISFVQREIAALHESVRELVDEVAVLRRRNGARRRRGRPA